MALLEKNEIIVKKTLTKKERRKDDYPTIEFLENYARQKSKALQFSVKDDIIRIHK